MIVIGIYMFIAINSFMNFVIFRMLIDAVLCVHGHTDVRLTGVYAVMIIRGQRALNYV